MASTGAVLYLRPRGVATEVPGRKTAATVYVPMRMLSGLVTARGVTASRNQTNLSTLLPHITRPFAQQDRNGRWACDPHWYRFFDFLVNDFLAGASGPTLADIITSIVAVQTSATAAEMRSVLLASQAQTNAEALSTAVQVVQIAALPGADQIPPVRRYYLEP